MHFRLIALMFLSLMTVSSLQADDLKEIKRVKAKVVKEVKDIAGGNISVGIGLCDPSTGLQIRRRSDTSELCVLVTTDAESTLIMLETLYPLHTRIDGHLVALRLTGVIRPRPRISAGN